MLVTFWQTSAPRIFPNGAEMNKVLFPVFVIGLLCCGLASDASAQQPSISDLVRDIDKRAEQVKNPSFNFQNPFAKLKMPNFGLLDKLKDFGKPATGNATAQPQGGFFTQTAKPSLLDRLLGRDPKPQQQGLVDDLNNLARGAQNQAGQWKQNAQGTFEQFSLGQNGAVPSPQPPLRSARQPQGSGSRY